MRHLLSANEATAGIVVGRRPVVDDRLRVHGFRLVVWGTSQEIPLAGALARRVVDDGGAARLFGPRRAFVLPSLAFLYGEDPIDSLPRGSVIEVDESIGTDAAALDGCRRLVQAGFKLAVVLPGPEVRSGALGSMASYFCIDINAVTGGLGLHVLPEAAELADLGGVKAAAAAGRAHLVALNVDAPAQFATARAAGFELFQGRFLSALPAPSDEALTPARMACLELLEKVNDPDTSAADLELVVASDPALSYRLLHVSGLGAEGGLRRPVRSVREAAVLMGRDYIKRWLVLMLMADANHGAPEQLLVAITRARVCEEVAQEVRPAERDAAFTVGLVSALHLLLGSTLPEVVAKLAIHPDLKVALLDHGGWLGGLLADVLTWESGELPVSLRSEVDAPTLERLYLDAALWACGFQESLLAAA